MLELIAWMHYDSYRFCVLWFIASLIRLVNSTLCGTFQTIIHNRGIIKTFVCRRRRSSRWLDFLGTLHSMEKSIAHPYEPQRLTSLPCRYDFQTKITINSAGYNHFEAHGQNHTFRVNTVNHVKL